MKAQTVKAQTASTEIPPVIYRIGPAPATEVLTMFEITPAGPGRGRERGGIIALTAIPIDPSRPAHDIWGPLNKLWEAPGDRGGGGS